jgi:hypothetical protein
LNYNSCVNKETRIFNRKLNKVAKTLNKTTIINIDMEREYYTMHGLHQNKKGKTILAAKIFTAIQDIVGTQIGNPAISLNSPTFATSEITKGSVQPAKIQGLDKK